MGKGFKSSVFELLEGLPCPTPSFEKKAFHIPCINV